MMLRRLTLVVLVLLGMGVATALEVVLAPTLPAEVPDLIEQALGDWRAAGVDVDAVEASLSVRVGAAERFGPDVMVWVVARGASDDGVRRFELLIAPEAQRLRAALSPALGVVLGGELGEGALNPVLDREEARRPTEQDGNRIERLRTAILGDINGDGLVDFNDLLLLAASFGQRGINNPADLNSDGTVDAQDLELLRQRYTFTPPAPSSTER
jgi:hypothetical protein